MDKTEELVEKAKLTAQYLDQKYGESFSRMFAVEEENNIKISH